jgi:hypothetical protein
MEVLVDRKPLVMVSEYSPKAWVIAVNGGDLSMVRDKDGVWSPGIAMPQTSFDMIMPEEPEASKVLQEARAALAADPSLADAPYKALV